MREGCLGWIDSHAWRPRLTAAIIFVRIAEPIEGFGVGFASFEKVIDRGLEAAPDRNAPRSIRTLCG